MKDSVRINKAGCFSQCGHGPMIVVYPENVWYARRARKATSRRSSSRTSRTARRSQRLVYDPGVKGANKTKDAL